jgi:hypothetical protein
MFLHCFGPHSFLGFPQVIRWYWGLTKAPPRPI